MSAADKIERLFNLIALLLNADRPLPADEIRTKIPGYEGQSDTAFHRMFERDKDELKDLGYVVEIDDADLWGAPGYVIRRREGLPEDPGFTAQEMAALSLAVQAWGDEGAHATLGLLKLSVGSGVAEPGPTGWVLPRVPVDRNVATLLDAIARRKRVQFRYRTGGGGAPQERTVDPYAVRHRGVWYVTGFDHARGEERIFRLTRVDGSIRVGDGSTPDFEAPASVAIEVPRGPWEGEAVAEAVVGFAPEAAWWAQRRTDATVVRTREDGWVELRMPVSDVEPFAGWVAGFAAAAEVVEPPEVRAAVIRRLTEAMR